MTENQSSAQADVLGRLLVLQQTLDALPDETRVAEFTKQALMTVPGVSEVLMYIGDPMLSHQAKLQEIRAQCVRQGCMPNSPDPTARSDEGGIHYFPLRKESHLFGFLTVRAADEGMLDPYIDLLSNIANAIGNVLDSRLHHTQLSKTTELTCGEGTGGTLARIDPLEYRAGTVGLCGVTRLAGAAAHGRQLSAVAGEKIPGAARRRRA
jgi:hypothetical protein